VVPLSNGLPYWFFHRFGGELEGTTLTASDRLVWNKVDPARVIGCVSFVAGEVVGPSYSRWLSKWPPSKATLTFGGISPSGEPSSTGHSAEALAALFEASEVPLGTRVLPAGGVEIRREVFEKLMVNASVNTLCTLARADCGELTGSDGLRRALRRVCSEVHSLAAAMTPPIALRADADSVLQKYDRQFGLIPSMLQDLRAARPLEHEAIVCALVALAERLDVEVPTLDLLASLLHVLDPGAAGGPSERRSTGCGRQTLS